MDQDRNQDRERLSGVHRTEQTESKINEDFVEWLKTKGPSWLLMLLVFLTLYLGLVRWRDSREAHQANAWIELAEAQQVGLPSTLESVAEQYPDVGSVAILARLQAAERLINAVQLGLPIDATQQLLDEDMDEDDLPRLSDEDREHYLDRADRLFRTVLEADDGSWTKTLIAVSALHGRAAIAEARGEIDQARGFYEQSALRAEAHYPDLARQANRRIETIELAMANVHFPPRDEIYFEDDEDDPWLRPLDFDPSLQWLLLTDDDLQQQEQEVEFDFPFLPGGPGIDQ